MPLCRKCSKCYAEDNRQSFCDCGGIIDGLTMTIHGTRDQFGINNAFTDEKTGQVIDTRPKWEKAGYRDTLEGDSEMNQMIKSYKKDAKHKKKLDPGHKFL